MFNSRFSPTCAVRLETPDVGEETSSVMLRASLGLIPPSAKLQAPSYLPWANLLHVCLIRLSCFSPFLEISFQLSRIAQPHPPTRS
eukprot:767051-Hanusia_phi.AAC.5